MPGENDFSLQGISDMYGQGNIWQSDDFQPALQGFADQVGYTGNLFGNPYTYQQENSNEGGQFSQDMTANQLSPELLSALKGYSFKPTGPNSLSMYKGNNLVNTQQYGSQDSWFDKLAMAGIPMALTGGAGGGLAGLFGGGMLGSAAGYGLANAGMADFMGGDAAKGFLSGAVGGGMANAGGFTPSNLAGIENKTLGNIFNKGVGSAVGTLATGGSGSDALKSGLTSAGITAGNSFGAQGMDYIADAFKTLMPQSDTEFANLQGSMGDASGQTDVTPSSYDEGGSGYRYAGDQPFSMAPVGQKQIQEVGSPSALSSLFSNAASGIGKFVGNNAGDLASMLYGFYNNRKQQNALGQQLTSMQGLYGQNSPYAQQLRATLAAKAAQQGKRSNIAGRETQLQAALADRYAQLQPSMLQINQARGGLQNQNMNMLLQGMNKLGGWNTLGQGLQGMFGGNTYSNGGYNLTGTQNPYGSDIAFNGWQ